MCVGGRCVLRERERREGKKGERDRGDGGGRGKMEDRY